MIKNEKGVTLVALIITIIVMIILASITIAASTNLNKETQLKNLQTNMMLIQAKAEEIYNKYECGDISELPGEDCDDNDALTSLNQSNDEEYIKHLVNSTEEKNLGLEVGSEDFYVNYKTGEVYSKTGFKEGNTIKHLLSELKNY